MSSIRVLVVDDSALMRKLIPQMIEHDPALHVVGTAMDGEFALKKIPELRPDVVTLDMEMPRMDGMETLKQIVRHHPALPVVVVSAHTTEGASQTFKALSLGALDFIAKPHDALSGNMDAIGQDLINKLKAAAMRRVVQPVRPMFGGARAARKQRVERTAAARVLAIGASTGGPNAVEYVLSQLPENFPAAILIVQHMPVGFTDMFARRLDEACAIDVKEAVAGDLMVAGRALICPGDRHMKVRRMPLGNVVVLNDDERVNGHRPSVDVLFGSVAEEFGPFALGLLMTGMGEDGADGLGRIKKAGGFTVAQDEESSVVYGMPRVATERGYATRVMGLAEMPQYLISYFSESLKVVTEQV
ncbi:MAG TPA: chemotaxis response regulator protein-glutamate methylesterase [Candidatus Acidoferrales bacterium]|nr:chemotaxis response regulator protein-glutamate methylesterase [Candidatus Acidoferrales bacterium]